MIQYNFKVTLFNEATQEIEKFNGVNSLTQICDELFKMARAKDYHIVEFFAKSLTPGAKKLKP